jgi:hypothetical protein
MKFKIGQRVKHEYLGEGEVIKFFKDIPLVSVKFDNIPDVRYNMGENPTAVWYVDLKELK